MSAETADLLSVKDNASAGTAGIIKAGQGVHRGRLSSAVCANQSDDLALIHIEVQPVQCLDISIAIFQILHFQQMCQLSHLPDMPQ